jgi:hypothetical protein
MWTFFGALQPYYKVCEVITTHRNTNFNTAIAKVLLLRLGMHFGASKNLKNFTKN